MVLVGGNPEEEFKRFFPDNIKMIFILYYQFTHSCFHIPLVTYYYGNQSRKEQKKT
jgi:hypothetical protein